MKNTLNLLIFLGLIIAYYSCEISDPIIINGEERYNSKGRVVDKNGQPLANIWVYIRACKNDFNCSLIGLGQTDTRGNFNILHAGNDALFYGIHINDSHISHTDADYNINYPNSSIKVKIDAYGQYHHDFGDIGYLGESTNLTVSCKNSSNKPCTVSVNSNKMDTQLEGFDIIDKKYKYYTIDNNKSVSINVPQYDTIQIEYKTWERVTFFSVWNKWHLEKVVMQGSPNSIEIKL